MSRLDGAGFRLWLARFVNLIIGTQALSLFTGGKRKEEHTIWTCSLILYSVLQAKQPEHGRKVCGVGPVALVNVDSWYSTHAPTKHNHQYLTNYRVHSPSTACVLS